MDENAELIERIDTSKPIRHNTRDIVAAIIEIQVKLNEINFDKDNTIIDADDISDESLGNTSEEVNTNNTNNSNQNNTKNENAQPPETNRQLSKKERRQKAREQREQQNRANVNNNESSNTEKNEDVKPDSDVVPESAIEE